VNDSNCRPHLLYALYGTIRRSVIYKNQLLVGVIIGGESAQTFQSAFNPIPDNNNDRNLSAHNYIQDFI
jgi:hypothetical protein